MIVIIHLHILETLDHVTHSFTFACYLKTCSYFMIAISCNCDAYSIFTSPVNHVLVTFGVYLLMCNIIVPVVLTTMFLHFILCINHVPMLYMTTMLFIVCLENTIRATPPCITCYF